MHDKAFHFCNIKNWKLSALDVGDPNFDELTKFDRGKVQSAKKKVFYEKERAVETISESDGSNSAPASSSVLVSGAPAGRISTSFSASRPASARMSSSASDPQVLDLTNRLAKLTLTVESFANRLTIPAPIVPAPIVDIISRTTTPRERDGPPRCH
jgi:hypothetical protein